MSLNLVPSDYPLDPGIPNYKVRMPEQRSRDRGSPSPLPSVSMGLQKFREEGRGFCQLRHGQSTLGIAAVGPTPPPLPWKPGNDAASENSTSQVPPAGCGGAPSQLQLATLLLFSCSPLPTIQRACECKEGLEYPDPRTPRL